MNKDEIFYKTVIMMYKNILRDIFELRKRRWLTERYRDFLSGLENDMIIRKKFYDVLIKIYNESHQTQNITGRQIHNNSISAINNHNRIKSILYQSVTLLYNSLIEGGLSEKENFKIKTSAIREYYKEYNFDNTECIQNLYSKYNYSDDEKICEVISDGYKIQEIIIDIMDIIPPTEILVLYLYFKYHTTYNADVFDAVNKIVAYECEASFCILTSADKRIQEQQSAIMEEENIAVWRNDIYTVALANADKCPAIAALIPDTKYLKRTVKAEFKEWDDKQIKAGEKRASKDISAYADKIKEMLQDKVMPKIIKKGSSDRYSNSSNSITLITLHKVINDVFNDFFSIDNPLDETRYPYFEKRYSDLSIDKFVIACEDFYSKKHYRKEETNTVKTLANPDIIKDISHMIIYLYIMSAFGSNNLDFISNKTVQIILIFYQGLIKNNIINEYSEFPRLACEILKLQ